MRNAILQALTQALPFFSGMLLDVGCGDMPYRPLIMKRPSAVSTYVGLDIRNDAYGGPDVEWDGITIPFASRSVDCAIATEVLEHCPEPDEILAEIFRVLRPDGYFFATVPFLWPLHLVPYDEYRYTPFSMERLMRSAGFREFEIRALGGWDASLAQIIGLWVRRRPMRRRVRSLLSRGLLPIIAFLKSKDAVPAQFTESTMISGLAVSARKQGKL
jgi:SAM-dependent methyltransferase